MNEYDVFTTYDLPIPYQMLKFYPVSMRDYFHFMTASHVLTLDKNSVPDAKIISMSYLEYVYHAGKEEPYLMVFLDRILHICLGIPDDQKISYLVDKKGKPIIGIGGIDGDIFDEKDFDEIREIIIEQNLLHPPNDNIEKSLRDSMDEAKRLRRERSGMKAASLEDQMIALTTATSMTLSEIYDMTIRKFLKTLERADHKLHYEIYLSASMSGMVTFKDKSIVKHWLSGIARDEFEGLMSYDAFETKINSANV